jgi:hypothetical protein
MAETEVQEVVKTTIQISVDTRTILMALGKKGDSYDDIISKIADFYIKNKKE